MHPISPRIFHRFRKAVQISLASTMACSAALFAGPAGSALAAPAVTSPMVLAAGSVPITLVRATPIHGGDVATTWKTGAGLEMKAAGAVGSMVSLHRTARHAAMATARPPASATTPAQYAKSGRSVYWDALAVGATPAQAAKTTLALGARLPAGVRAPAAALSARPATGIYNSVCTQVGAEPGVFPGGDAIQGYACLIQDYLEQKPGAWYISNEISAEGTSYAGSLGNLTSLRAWDCYCNGYTYYLVQSHPNATINEGSPSTTTFSVSAGGVGVSDSVTIYPANERPYYPDGPTNGQSYGATWNGSAYNGTWVDDDSLSLIHDGHGTTNDANVSVAIWWNWP